MDLRQRTVDFRCSRERRGNLKQAEIQASSPPEQGRDPDDRNGDHQDIETAMRQFRAQTFDRRHACGKFGRRMGRSPIQPDEGERQHGQPHQGVHIDQGAGPCLGKRVNRQAENEGGQYEDSNRPVQSHGDGVITCGSFHRWLRFSFLEKRRGRRHSRPRRAWID